MPNIHSNCTNCINREIKKSMWKTHRVLIFLRKGFYADTCAAIVMLTAASGWREWKTVTVPGYNWCRRPDLIMPVLFNSPSFYALDIFLPVFLKIEMIKCRIIWYGYGIAVQRGYFNGNITGDKINDMPACIFLP